MFPKFFPQEINLVKNSDLIFLAKNIKHYLTPTSLSNKEIATAGIKLGTKGSPILLLHGLDSSILEFYSLIPLLSANRETWAIDLLGSGFTERLSNIAYNPHTIREHLYSVWQTLIQRPVVLVGCSMGGATAIDLTLFHPEIVEKLVLINSVGYSGIFPVKEILQKPIMKLLLEPIAELVVEDWRKRRIHQLFWSQQLNLLNPEVKNAIRDIIKDIRLPNFLERKLDLLYPEAEDIIRCAILPSYMPNWKKAFKSFVLSGGYDGIQESIHLINKPTLILWGEKDNILGTKAAFQFRETIINSQLIWLSKAGHSPQIEQPKNLANHLLYFAK